MQVEIVTPLGEQYTGDAVKLEVPGLLGEMGILPGHRDLLAALGTGICRIFEAEHADPIKILLDEGYVQVSAASRIIIVTEQAETKDDIDVDKTRDALGRARSELSGTREDVGTRTWQTRRHAVALHEARLRLVDAL